MVSQGLLIGMAILLGLMLVGFLMNLTHCLVSCFQGVPHGEEHENTRVAEEEYHWLISGAGNVLYCIFCSLPCNLFCRHTDNVVLV